MQQLNARKDAPGGDEPEALSYFYASAAGDETLLGSGGLVALIRFPVVLVDPLEWRASDTLFRCPQAGFYDIQVIVSVGSPHGGLDNYGWYFFITTPNCSVLTSGRNIGNVGPNRDSGAIRVFDYFNLGDQMYVQGAQYSASGLNSPPVGQANNILCINPIG